MRRPPSGSMVYWRPEGSKEPYRFGYVTYVSGPDLIRMGRWNGDAMGGPVVSAFETEWRPYQ